MYSDTPSCLIRCALGRVRTLALGLACVLPMAAGATPPGWSTAVPVTIIEESGVDLADYQVRLVVDTASLIGAGEMKPDASDLRFATDFEGSNDRLLDRGRRRRRIDRGLDQGAVVARVERHRRMDVQRQSGCATASTSAARAAPRIEDPARRRQPRQRLSPLQSDPCGCAYGECARRSLR